ncbi:MAG: hypothetical protein Q4C71_01175 [Microbacteriaceae bacterium]|nr:hypothetical protein [Microbacteriaceae bacterium]
MNRKKISALIAAAALSAGLLAGCASHSSSEQRQNDSAQSGNDSKQGENKAESNCTKESVPVPTGAGKVHSVSSGAVGGNEGIDFVPQHIRCQDGKLSAEVLVSEDGGQRKHKVAAGDRITTKSKKILIVEITAPQAAKDKPIGAGGGKISYVILPGSS